MSSKIFASILLLLHIGFSTASKAQNKKPKSKQLVGVTIKKSTIENYLNGVHLQNVDAVTLQQNASNSLANTLMENTSLQIRSTVPGMLATISSRGSSPSHVAVIWNGVNINAVTNGQVDASLLPSIAFDEVQVGQNGFSSSAVGNALGACVLLKNGIATQNNFSVGMAYGSFLKQNYFAKINIGKNKIRFNAFANYVTAKNNFTFFNTAVANKPLEKMQHANYMQLNALANLIYNINSKSALTFNMWAQNSNRLIPATLTQASSNRSQLDASSKWNALYKCMFRNNARLDASLTYLHDVLNYKDVDININSIYKTHQIISNVIVNTSIKDSSINMQFGVQHNAIIANAIELGGNIKQNRTACFGNLSKAFGNKKNVLSVSFRQELVQQKWIPFSANIGYSKQIKKTWNISGNVSKNYRLPTFNDLFWYQGGNALLLPEQSFNAEASIFKQTNISKVSLRNTITFFNKQVKNWIQWTPINVVWRPINVLQVWSRGIESQNVFNYIINSKTNLTATILYSYTKCTNEAVAANAASSLHKQLMYVPLHKTTLNGRYTFRKTSFQYNFLLEGMRYTSSDNATNLELYNVHNCSIMQSFGLPNALLHCSFNALNLFNTNYQHIAFNPNPLRNYNLSVTYTKKI